MTEDAKPRQAGFQLTVPDGGWGWAVLCGAMLSNLLIQGSIKSMGIIYREVLDMFPDASSSQVAWISSLCFCLYSGLAPVSSTLCTKYSNRMVTLIGGTLASTGIFISSFAPNVTFLYLSLGILLGCGAGLSFTSGILIVSEYFEKRRGLVNGLCVSSNAIGGVLMPILLGFLLDEYQYRGSLVILGGVMLNTLVAGALFQPVEKHMKVVKIDDGEANANEDDFCEPLMVQQRKQDSPCIEEITPNSDSFHDELQPDSGYNTVTQNNQAKFFHEALKKEDLEKAEVQVLSKSFHDLPSIAEEDPIPFEHRRSSCMRSFSSLHITSFRLGTATTMIEDEAKHTVQKIKDEYNQTQLNVKQKEKTFDLSILKNPVYLIIALAYGSTGIGFTNFTLLLPTYACTALGFTPTQSNSLISVISFCDLCGRLSGAFVADCLPLPKRYLFFASTGLSGIILWFSLLPGLEEFVCQAVMCGIFGFVSGLYVGIFPSMLADELGASNVKYTFPFSLLLTGVVQLFGPPLFSYILDVTGNFDLIFHILSFIMVLGGALIFLHPCAVRRNL